ncbi:hypothetical protein Bca4012_065803 [Brassica carinata]
MKRPLSVAGSLDELVRFGSPVSTIAVVHTQNFPMVLLPSLTWILPKYLNSIKGTWERFDEVVKRRRHTTWLRAKRLLR